VSPTWMIRHAGDWIPANGNPPPDPPDNVPPNAPTGLTAGSVTTSGATITWTASIDPDGSVVNYQVLVGGAVVASPTATTANITGLTPGTEYTVAVRAVDNVGAQSTATSIQVTTAATPPPSSFTHGSQVNASNVGLLVATTRTLAGKVYASAADMTTANGVISGNGSIGNPWVVDRVRFTSDVVVGDWSSSTIVGKYIKFQNCRFEGNPTSSTVGGSAYLSAIRPYGPAGLEVVDSTLGPLAGPGAGVGVDKGIQSYYPLTVRRCNIFGACILYYLETSQSAADSLCEDSYLHHIWSSSGDHTDIINGNFHASNVTVQRCYLDGIRTGGSVVTNAFGMYDDPTGSPSGIFKNWTIRSNYVRRAATYILSTTSTSRFLGPYVVEDNIFTSEFTLLRFSTRPPTSQSSNRDENSNPLTI
jgi:hypothetical protein